MFVDEVTIHVRAGHGGKGCCSFRREKYIPLGGPDGGNGGKGADIVVVADPHTRTLIDYRYRPHHFARHGQHGSGSRSSGAAEKDIVLPVPQGTIVRIKETGEIIADLVEPGQRVIVAKGGRGGLGNAHFVTATNQAPRKTQPGEEGEEFELVLELKLLADIGIVGFPNAGKSTLISTISAAKPKIADYPFTTLTPNLGVVRLEEGESFVVADVPGLITGASHGAGLGTRFLRHLARTKLLVHLVDLSPDAGRDPVEDYKAINAELKEFGGGLEKKPQLLVASKADIPEAAANLKKLQTFAKRKRIPCYVISAATHQGVKELVFAMKQSLDALERAEREKEAAARPVRRGAKKA